MVTGNAYNIIKYYNVTMNIQLMYLNCVMFSAKNITFFGVISTDSNRYMDILQ